jgi:hypothetical protein
LLISCGITSIVVLPATACTAKFLLTESAIWF